MLRSLLAMVFLTAGGLGAHAAQAQSYLVDRPGPMVSLDLAGGPFPAITPAGTDISGGVGWRLGRGVDLALILGRGGADADTLFPYPAELHVGVEVSAALGTQRRWRLAVTANTSIAGSNTFLFPASGGPTTTQGGPDVIERRARASATRYLPLADGARVQVLAGVGVYGAVREVRFSTLVFQSGGADERTVGGETVTETSVGIVGALPVVVRITPRVDLVIEPELRVDPLALLFGVGDGQVTVRLNL